MVFEFLCVCSIGTYTPFQIACNKWEFNDFFFAESSKGPCKVRNETETKRYETKQIETKRNKSKRNETDRNETKQIETKRNKTKRNKSKRNETSYMVRQFDIYVLN